jgi:hypothetical protein
VRVAGGGAVAGGEGVGVADRGAEGGMAGCGTCASRSADSRPVSRSGLCSPIVLCGLGVEMGRGLAVDDGDRVY